MHTVDHWSACNMPSASCNQKLVTAGPAPFLFTFSAQIEQKQGPPPLSKKKKLSCPTNSL